MRSNDNKTRKTYAGRALLLTMTILTPLANPWTIGMASAQETAVVSVNVRPQELGSALTSFADQAGLRLLFASGIVAGKRAPALSGEMTREEALSRLLAGTGLSYRFTSAGTVTITDRVSAAHSPVGDDGSLMLDTIKVTGAGGGSSVYSPYETAAATSHISEQNIERFRGSSPADIFRGTPGVRSGEARNGAGAIDVNVRGMQGMGRVAVTVDGAENSLQIYQGYQGISNRTFVDPDLLAGIDITKGSDAASNGVAGTVAMRTLDASDIVDDGKQFGLRIKGGFGTNSSTPRPGSAAGYQIINNPGGFPSLTESPTGMDRPSFLEPTNGSGSVVAAMKEENIDLIAGYAYRKRGNYHAGSNGPSVNPVHVGPRPFCYAPGSCIPSFEYKDFIENHGLANYRPGEEVLNTQLETKSWITKGTLRFGDGHSLQLGYTGYRSEAGDALASLLTNNAVQAIQQRQTAGTKLDTGTLQYRWKPEGNDLIDLKANIWGSGLELRNPPRNRYGTPPEQLGLPPGFRPGSDTVMWGADITNKSSFATDHGTLDLTYGASYRSEDTRPSAYTAEIEGWLNLRDAKRDETSAFVKAAYKPLDWLSLNAGLRYTQYRTSDRHVPRNSGQINPQPDRSEDGFSPFLGVTVEPFDGTQLYANYSSAMRFPSLFESVSAFTIVPNPDLRAERSNNWEIGANHREDDLFANGDTAMVKLGYFNWNVDDYIARSFREIKHPDLGTFYGMQVYNIDRARFSGLELSARYELEGFTAELAANYYLNVEFCQISGVCENKSMYGDYATNQVPPKYSIDLTLSQKLLDEALTVGGRISYTGPRAIGHGQVTGQGLSQFISLIHWEPYTLVDVFAEYKINDNFTASASIENLFDKYYVDPLSLVQQPGPGRTFYASLTAKF